MSVFPDDKELGAASSSATETLDEAQDMADGHQESADAGSSSAEGESEDKSTLDVVRDVVAGDKKEDASAAASPAEGSEANPEAGEPSDKPEPDNENFSDVPFHKHPRFKELVSQRNSFREDATRYRNVQSFIDDNGLTSEEAANILVSAAKAKTDPVGCWQEIKPWVQKLLIAAGEVLPDDLSQRVQRGEISHEAAVELSRAQARVHSVEASRTFEHQRAEQRAQAQLQADIQSTVQAWENDRAVKDPNFAAKYPLIIEKLKVIQFDEGKPTTPRGVQEQLEKAYRAINGSFRPAPPPAPTKRPMRPVTGGNHSASAATKSGETSTLDVIRRVRGR